MRVDVAAQTLYPAPVQSVRSVTPVKRESVIEQYNLIASADERNNAIRKRFDTFERTEEKPDFKAINLIKKSEIPPPEPPTVDELRAQRDEFPPKIEVRTDIAELNGEQSEKSGISVERQEEIRSERIEKTATAKSSDEIEKESVGTRLTPAQQKGVEVYQRIQKYADPMSLSNARIAV